jgi:hypothetical protein
MILKYTQCGDCDSDHYLAFTKVRERLSIIKHEAEKYNKFAALENLSDRNDGNRAWENIKQSINISAKGRLGV